MIGTVTMTYREQGCKEWKIDNNDTALAKHQYGICSVHTMNAKGSRHGIMIKSPNTSQAIR
ncbi:hypothetical protein PBN151_1740 [Paenibacillus sp. NAIST15-1]|nr:hypothetical protein PBN151_1740 [Paenibacillus sp. NAIST15-1]